MTASLPRLKTILTLVVLGAGTFSLRGQEAVRLVAPDYPPYTIKDRDSVAGTGMILITRLFNDAGIPFVARPTSNYTRALSDLTSGEADGFFQAAQTPERDAVAEYIQIGMNAWSWFLVQGSALRPDDSGFRQSARIGTVLNSSQQSWLQKHGYTVSATPADAVALIRMLHAGRMDAAFTSEDVFRYSLPKTGYAAEEFRCVLGVLLPTGLYLSRSWVKAHPAEWLKLQAAAHSLPGNP